jgi:hypothetical protein
MLKMIEMLLIEVAREATMKTRDNILELINQIRDILALDDYNPPRYTFNTLRPEIKSPDDELKYLQTFSEKIRAKSNVLRDADESIPDFGGETDLDIDKNSASRFAFLRATVPAIVVPEWFVVFLAWLCRQSLYMECVMQLFRLWKLKRKYESAAHPDLPDLNYTGESQPELPTEDNRECDGSRNKRSYLMFWGMLFKQFLSSWLFVGAVCIPMMCVILFLWFPHVKRSCIDSRNGTVVAQNILAPMLINKANVKGFSVNTNLFTSCQIKQHLICNRKRAETRSIYQVEVDRFDVIQNRFNASKEFIGVLNRCVDLEYLDDLFGKHCCGIAKCFEIT